jgi:hypothetical protein
MRLDSKRWDRLSDNVQKTGEEGGMLIEHNVPSILRIPGKKGKLRSQSTAPEIDSTEECKIFLPLPYPRYLRHKPRRG